MGESRARIAPLLGAVGLGIRGGVDALVVVDYYLVELGIPLAGQQHVGARILQHGHQIGQHETLREEILHRLPETRPLPTPYILLLVEVTAVTLPHGDVAARKALRRRILRRDAAHQRVFRPVGETHAALRRGAVVVRNKILDAAVVGDERQLVFRVLRRQRRAHRVVHRPHVILAERIVRQTDRGIYFEFVARGIHAVDLHRAAENLATDDARKHLGHLAPLGRGEIARPNRRGRGQRRKHERGEQYITKLSHHGDTILKTTPI